MDMIRLHARSSEIRIFVWDRVVAFFNGGTAFFGTKTLVSVSVETEILRIKYDYSWIWGNMLTLNLNAISVLRLL